jgi:hypothetical protein
VPRLFPGCNISGKVLEFGKQREFDWDSLPKGDQFFRWKKRKRVDFSETTLIIRTKLDILLDNFEPDW